MNPFKGVLPAERGKGGTGGGGAEKAGLNPVPSPVLKLFPPKVVPRPVGWVRIGVELLNPFKG